MQRNPFFRRAASVALFVAGLLGGSVAAQAAETFRVAYAGSMGVVMDKHIGPAFAKAHDVTYQGIGQGAYALAHQIKSKILQADVFISITPGPIDVLKGDIGPAEPVASTQMVIAYSPKSRFAAELKAAAEGGKPWYEVLEMSGLRFGRTDPKTDPQGQNIIFSMLLAQKYYKQPGLADKILGAHDNPKQIFTEPSLLSRLEAGQIDATSGYLSAVRSHHLPFIKLPDEINLSNPAMQQDWYGSVHVQMKGPDGKDKTLHTQPLVFYAAVVKDSKHPKLAAEFVAFLQSPEGQKMLTDTGYSSPKGKTID